MLENTFLENIFSRLSVLYTPVPEVMGGVIYRESTLRDTGNIVGLQSPPTSVSGWGFSKQGKGELRFNQDGYVDCGSEFRSPQFTLTAWINYTTALVGYMALISNTTLGSQTGWILDISGFVTDKIDFILQDPVTYTPMTDPNILVANRWCFICATYDGTIGRLYRDGVEVVNATGPIGYASTDSLILGDFGSTIDATYRFIGALGEVAMYDIALSPTEIQVVYNRSVEEPLHRSKEFPYPIRSRDYQYIKM